MLYFVRQRCLWLSGCNLRRAAVQPRTGFFNRAFASQSTPQAPPPLSSIVKNLKTTLAQRDVLFYEAPQSSHRIITILYLSAGVQLVFWGNISNLMYLTYGEKKSDEGNEASLAPKSKRLAISLGLFTIGLLVSGVMCAYPWRYVSKLTLLKGGKNIRVQTASWYPRFSRDYHIDDLMCKQKLFTGRGERGTETLSSSSHIFINAKNEKLAYVLDRRGTFSEPRIFDALLHKPGKWKK
ncbi:uncharacterized protein VTP21DRAFT_3611 [Calcarisporiella thermophila]|uniref:uncharacterized protein n=1 Tax=Calcarisporiella thermophila TaxID=911321 RepID=UPI003744B21D